MSVMKMAQPAPGSRQSVPQRQTGPATSGIDDLRAYAVAQGRRQQMMDNSPQATQMKARLALVDNAVSQRPLQRIPAALPAPVASPVTQLAYDEVVGAEAEAAAKYTFETYKDAAATVATKEETLRSMPGYTKPQKALREPHETEKNKATTTKTLAFAQLDKWHKVGANKKLAEQVVAGKAKGSWDKGTTPFKEVIEGAVAVETEEAKSAYNSVINKDSIALGKESDTQNAAKNDDTVAGLESTSWGWGVNLAFVEAAVDHGKDINLVTAIPVAAKAILAPDNTQGFAEYVVSSHTNEAEWRSLWQGLKGRPTWYTYELDYLKRRGYSLDGSKMAAPDELQDHKSGDEAPAIGHAIPYTYAGAYKKE